MKGGYSTKISILNTYIFYVNHYRYRESIEYINNNSIRRLN